jgi:hypothetical protein
MMDGAHYGYDDCEVLVEALRNRLAGQADCHKRWPTGRSLTVRLCG